MTRLDKTKLMHYLVQAIYLTNLTATVFDLLSQAFLLSAYGIFQQQDAVRKTDVLVGLF